MQADAFNDMSHQKIIKLLRRHVDVLGIDIFLINDQGQVFQASEDGGKRRTAKKILMSILGKHFSQGKKFRDIFEDRGGVLEYQMACGLCVFAIPATSLDGFLMFGPLALTRRPIEDECLCNEVMKGFSKEDVSDMVHQVRVMSFVMVQAVVDLFKEVVSWVSDMPYEALEREGVDRSILDKVLDAAMRMTGASSGSIMLADKDSQYLEVCLMKGIEKKGILGARSDINNSVSGAVFNRNRTCFFDGQTGDEGAQPFLKRSDVKRSLVMPLLARDKVFGVMNLNADEKTASVDFQKKLSYLTGLVGIFS